MGHDAWNKVIWFDLMDSDLALVNGKSGRQSWRYADTFQGSITSRAIYHLLFFKAPGEHFDDEDTDTDDSCGADEEF